MSLPGIARDEQRSLCHAVREDARERVKITRKMFPVERDINKRFSLPGDNYDDHLPP